MNLPNDKEFDLAVEKAIDEIFGSAEEKVDPSSPVQEDDNLKMSLELEPLELENKEESKVIDFPNIDDLIENNPQEQEVKNQGLTQEDLERLAAAILSLEWEVTPETCYEFLSVLEEAKQSSSPQLHEIFELMHQVGTWLRDRPEEARPEWLHFLHQGVVALNLITVHGKEPESYVAHLKKALEVLKKKPPAEHEQLIKNLLRQLVADYQRFIIFHWLFSQAQRLRPWQGICEKSLKEIENLVADLPESWRPNLKEIAENARKKLKAKKLPKTALSPPQKETVKRSPSSETISTKEVPFKEAYLFRLGEEKWLVPAEEVAYIGAFKENWRNKINGQFPLRLLLGFWVYFSFVKLKNKLTGELREKEEKELRQLSLPVLKESPNGQELLLLWKNGKGGAVICDETEFLEIPSQAKLIGQEKPLVCFEDQKIPLFSWS